MISERERQALVSIAKFFGLAAMTVLLIGVIALGQRLDAADEAAARRHVERQAQVNMNSGAAATSNSNASPNTGE